MPGRGDADAIDTLASSIRNGDPVDVAEFTSHHASLTRQLYPLLQQELRMLFYRAPDVPPGMLAVALVLFFLTAARMRGSFARR